ncbi:MAG: sugar ABC transporter permease [Bacteroidetes bacterium]|nr:sugar ABC transporter permease [Bacteroidota bacterium]
MLNSLDKKSYPLYFIIPGITLYTLLFILPSLLGFVYSLTNWNIYSEEIKFIGLENFREILTESSNKRIILNTFKFASVTAFFKVVIGLGLALLLNEGFRTKNVLRTLFYLPAILSPLVIGLIFTSILNPVRGLLNQALNAVGLDNLTHQWLADISTAMPAVMGVEIWRFSGYCMIIFLAGMQLIPNDLYEVSDIDGANRVQKFFHITLPFLAPALTINIILNTIWGLKAFDIIFVLTKGGPGHFTEVLNVAVFLGFSSGRYGFATALGVVIFLLTSVIAFLILKIMSKREVNFL